MPFENGKPYIHIKQGHSTSDLKDQIQGHCLFQAFITSESREELDLALQRYRKLYIKKHSAGSVITVLVLYFDPE